MIKLLAIGNSFSQDATYYLHQIAAADDVQMKVVNLYIGGCSLQQHWGNMESGDEEYLLEVNGASTGQYIGVQQALDMENWDYIVTQQASYDSGMPDTYHPYLENMIAYIKDRRPDSEILLQQTWAYESDSIHPGFAKYDHDQRRMYEQLTAAYGSAAEQNALRLLPCGDVIQQLRTKEPFVYGHGGMSLCRDGFHMNVIYGRYLLAAVWYRLLTGNRIGDNIYVPHTSLAPNAICDENVLRVIKEIVDTQI